MIWILCSIALFSITNILWTFVFSNWIDAHAKNKIPFKKLILGHLSCLLGSLTPGNLGSETLRVLLNKKWLEMNWAQTFYVSSLTSVYKLRSSLLIVTVLFLCFGPYDIRYLKALVETIVLLVSVLFILNLVRKRNQKVDAFFSPTTREKIKATSIFLSSYLCEFLSFWCCLRFLSISVPLNVSIAAFSIVHVLARIPLLPQGILITETLGYFLLDPLIPIKDQKLALLGMWGLVRLLSPHIVGVMGWIWTKTISNSFEAHSVN